MFSVDFHAWRSSRHARNGDPEKVVTFAHRNDLLGGHVTFNKLSIDHCCVAGRESWSNTEILLDRAHVGFYMINDGEAVSFKVLDPLLAAPTVSVTMDVDRQRLCCMTS